MGTRGSRQDYRAELMHMRELAIIKRQNVVTRLQILVRRVQNKEITQAEYQTETSRKINGRTLGEWVEYYESYIAECEIRLKTENRKQKISKTASHVLTLIIAATLIGVLIFTGPTLTGFIVKEFSKLTQQGFADQIDLQLNESNTYVWTPENNGTLGSVSISGSIKGNGTVRIYLENLLILDSTKLTKTEEQKRSASLITGNVIDEGSTDSTDTKESSDSSPTPVADSIKPASEPEPSPQPVSQTEPQSQSPSKAKIEQNESDPTEQNNTSPTPNEQQDNSKEKEAETNATIEPTPETQINETIPLEEIAIAFKKVCTETCDITSLNLSQLSYKIRIEINGVQLSLDTIHYTLITERAPLDTNATGLNISLTQGQAILNQPVEWTEEITLDSPTDLNIELPNGASNISIETENNTESAQTLTQISSIYITKKGQLETNTENAQKEENSKNKISVQARGSPAHAKITYLTKAPEAQESESMNTKTLNVTGDEEIHYENVLIHTSLNESWGIHDASKIYIYWIENQSYLPLNKVEDTNNNTIYDYLEWTAPHLSNQTFRIIIITKAEHLDENRAFISDIYESVKALDDKWSEPIKDNEYVRVTFEQKLTNGNDITLFPRILSGKPTIEVYEVNNSELISTFTNLNNNNYNTIYLSNLNNPQATFDLRVRGGTIELDHIIDPVTTTALNVNLIANPGQNGTLTARTTKMTRNSTLTNSLANQINKSDDNNSQFLGGTSALDAYVNVSFVFPSYEKLYKVFITAEMNSSGTDTKDLALFNYTSGIWIRVNSTTAATRVENVTYYNMTSFLTNNGTSNFIKNSILRVMAFNNGSAQSNLSVDLLQVNISYEPVQSPIINLISPSNGSSVTYSSISFNATFTDNWALSTAALYIWNSTGSLINQTNGTIVGTSDSKNTTIILPYPDTFLWNYAGVDNGTNSAMNATNFTLTFDAFPIVTVNLPLNSTIAAPVLFNVTLNENGNACNYTLTNGVSNYTMQKNGNLDFNATNATIADGSYNARYYCWDVNNNLNSTANVTFSIASNTAPIVTGVTIASSFNPTENSLTSIQFNFTAFDAEGSSNLNTIGIANFSRVGETTRQNTTCSQLNTFATNYANYSCIMNMWYFDGSGNWNITIEINDTSNAKGQNTTTTFTYNQLSAFVTSPSTLTWASLSPGLTNQTSNNDPIILNNTGNANITIIQINATNLKGETDSSKGIWAGNITMALVTGSSIECNGNTNQTTILSASAFVNITNATLPYGNLSVSGNAAENLYACIRTIGNELSQQAYSTTNEGSWTIRVLVIGIAFGSGAKRRKIKKDKLVKAIALITEDLQVKYSLTKQETIQLLTEELKEKYSLENENIEVEKENSVPLEIFATELGFLESLCKYLHEKENLRYSEIAELTLRDERTVWAACHKAKEKHESPITTHSKSQMIPLNIFRNRQNTIFESLVKYLKEKGMTYSQIATQLKRDQRNIRTVYMRTISRKV